MLLRIRGILARCWRDHRAKGVSRADEGMCLRAKLKGCALDNTGSPKSPACATFPEEQEPVSTLFSVAEARRL